MIGRKMGNKSKKKNKPKKVVPVASAAPLALSGRRSNVSIPPLTDEQKIAATQRLANLFKTISAPPEPIRDMLHRLEIPWRRTTLMGIDGEEDYILIKVSDLEAGEERNKNQGSLANRIYNNVRFSNGLPDTSSNSDNNADSGGSNGAGVSGNPVEFVGAEVSESAPAEYAGSSGSTDAGGNGTKSVVPEEDYQDYLKGMQG